MVVGEKVWVPLERVGAVYVVLGVALALEAW